MSQPMTGAAGETGRAPLAVAAALVLITAFYWVTQPSARFESGDGYFYALIAERCLPLQICDISNGVDTRSLLYHSINQSLYLSVSGVFPGIRAFDLIVFLSSVSGALSLVLLVRILRRALGLDFLTCCLASACLGFSYGFWRYAVEAEVYVPSIFLSLLVLNLLLDANGRVRNSWRAVVPAGVIAGLAVLFYRANVSALVLAIPALLLSRGRFSPLILYGTLAAAVVFTGLLGAFFAAGSAPATLDAFQGFVFRRSSEFSGMAALFDQPLVPVVNILGNLGALLWPFAIDPLGEQIQSLFPGRSFAEESFAARRYWPWVVPAMVALPVILGLFLWMAARTCRMWFTRRPHRLVVYCFVSIAIQGSIIALLAADAREPWIPVLLPAAILFAFYVLGPIARTGHSGLAVALLASFLVYNFFGGIGVLQARERDYDYARVEWLARNAHPSDRVLLSEVGWTFRMYLRYMADIHAIDLASPGAALPAGAEVPPTQWLDALVAETESGGGRLFVFEDFFQPSRRLAYVSRPVFERAKDVAAVARCRARLVHRGIVGGVYRVGREVAAPSDKDGPPRPRD